MTIRKQKILNAVVKEYVKTSKPVSSKVLVQKHKLGLSSATIRNEMKELAKLGYLSQPHTSAGRVPTEKAYRLFIKSLEDKPLKKRPAFAKASAGKKTSEDVFEKHFNYLFKQVAKEETRVFVGKEIPMIKTRRYTLIITGRKSPSRRKEFIGLLGPTRMRYDYNISLINRLKELLENYD